MVLPFRRSPTSPRQPAAIPKDDLLEEQLTALHGSVVSRVQNSRTAMAA